MSAPLSLDVITGIGINNSALPSDGNIIGGNSTDRALMAFLVDNNAVNALTKADVRFGGEALSVEPLTPHSWLICVILAFLVIPIDMVRKLIMNKS